MKNIFLVILLFMAFIFVQEGILLGNESHIKDMFSIGISCEETIIPLLRTKLKVTPYFCVEARIGKGDEIQGEDVVVGTFLAGGRIYYTIKSNIINPRSIYSRIYGGLEGDFISATILSPASLGSGLVTGIFVGAEKYVLKPLSISIDLGPYYTFIRHPYIDAQVSSFDIVINVLVNYYLW